MQKPARPGMCPKCAGQKTVTAPDGKKVICPECKGWGRNRSGGYLTK